MRFPASLKFREPTTRPDPVAEVLSAKQASAEWPPALHVFSFLNAGSHLRGSVVRTPTALTESIPDIRRSAHPVRLESSDLWTPRRFSVSRCG